MNDLFWPYFDAKNKAETAAQAKGKVNAKKVQPKEYGNVIHPSIIDIDDMNTPVIHKVPPPELHLLLGPKNHLYNELRKVWSGAEGWIQSFHVKKMDYHGGYFEGNDCRKILKKVDTLEERCPDELQGFSNTFRLFDNVVKACYGSELEKNYREIINEFTTAYLSLNISVTSKVHAVMFHIDEFCSFTRRV